MRWSACSQPCRSMSRMTICRICGSFRCQPDRRNRVKVGVPKEIKTHEYRVGLTPAGARELVQQGHHVLIEHDAGAGIGCSDDAYRASGAAIAATAAELFAAAQIIVKVKEPQPPEIA